MPAYSTDLRTKIIETYEAGGTSIRKVAERFCVSKGVVQRLINRRKAGEDLSPRQTGPKTPGILYRHREQVVELVEANPDWTLAEYCEGLAQQHDLCVGITTMWDFLEHEQLTLKKRPIAAPKRQQRRVNTHA